MKNRNGDDIHEVDWETFLDHFEGPRLALVETYLRSVTTAQAASVFEYPNRLDGFKTREAVLLGRNFFCDIHHLTTAKREGQIPVALHFFNRDIPEPL